MRYLLVVGMTLLCLSFIFVDNTNAAVNILDNPGFEELSWPPAYWSEWEGGGGASGYISNTVSHTGSQSAVRELYGNGDRWGGYSQDVNANPGDPVAVSGWLMSDSSDNPLKRGAEAYIELKFLDGSDNELAVYKSDSLKGASSWVQHSIVQEAPAGTAKARFSFVLYAAVRKSAGKVYFDDAAIEITVYYNPPGPEPNLLSNSSFEDSSWPPVNWSEWEGSVSNLSADGVVGYLNITVSHTGLQSAARKLYGSGIRWGGYSQDVTVNEENIVTASGWLMSSLSDDPLANGTEAYIELKFFDGSNGELAVYRSTPLTSASSWVQHSITETSPAGTITARFSFVLLGTGDNATGTVYFDDAVLKMGEPDTTPPVVTIASPEDQSTTDISPITVTGTVDDPTVATVDVDGNIEPVTGGSWSSYISLTEGANLIAATAADDYGNEGSDSITVYYNPPGPEPNLLSNSSFEDSGWPLASWNEWGGSTSNSPDDDGTAGYLSIDVSHTGLQSAVRKLYGSGIRWGGYSQEFPIIPGDTIDISGYIASFSTDDPLANGAEAWIEIKYISDLNNEIEKHISTKITGATGGWIELSLSTDVPRGAATAIFSFVLTGTDSSSGTVYFDEAYAAATLGTPPDPGVPFNKPQSTGAVQVSGNILLVDSVPFVIKGVCYQPAPIGYVPWEYDVYSDPDIYNRDLLILRDMGANVVRTYAKVTSTGFLDACYNGGVDSIYVVMGYYIDGHSDLSDAVIRDGIKSEFQTYVSTYKNHPAVLMWSPGNETELTYAGSDRDLYTLLNELAEVAYLEEGSPYHPVTAAQGNIYHIGDSGLLTTDNDMDYLDVWGANVYEGSTFGDMFDDYAQRSAKPFWISEFGVDAWHTIDKYGDPANGYLDETSQAQCGNALWDEIAARGDVCSGGTVFEYSDEWWKDQSGDITTHDYTGFPYTYTMTAHPDEYSSEEWYGVVAVSDNGTDPDIVTLREAFNGLKSRWAGPEAELKMHIDNISMNLVYTGPLVKAQAAVTVYDEDNQPVPGAVVSGSWSGLTNDTDSGQTDGTGIVIIESNKAKKPRSGSQFTFTVTNVELSVWIYDSAANVEESDSISIP